MNVRPVSVDRLEVIVARWRRQAIEARTDAVAAVYTQCANDADLILRDDETIPRTIGGTAGNRPPPPPSDKG